MFPVLSPSAGALGTTGSRTDTLAAVLGPAVGSAGWDFVDAAWDLRAELEVPRREGSTDVQTASMLALPGTAVDSQLGEEAAWSGGSRGQDGSGYLGSLVGNSSEGKGPSSADGGVSTCRHLLGPPLPLLTCPPVPMRPTQS